MQSLCGIISCVVFIWLAQRNNFVQSIFPHFYAFYCAKCTTSLWERGIGVGKRRRRPDGYEVGRSALLKTNAELFAVVICRGKVDAKPDISDHAHISASRRVVEPVFLGL